MTLVDTSVWIDHFRNGNRALTELLEADEVLIHPFVIGELACGNLRNRDELLRLLQALPRIGRADDGEVLHLIENGHLHDKGLGLIDIHLLAACLIEHCRLLTRDSRLAAAATALGLAG